MAALGGAPITYTLNHQTTSAANQTNTASFVYNSPSLSYNDVHYDSGGHATNYDSHTQTFVNPPAGKAFEFLFQILPTTAKATAFDARNVTLKAVSMTAPAPTSAASVDCFLEQASSNQNDAKAACSLCTINNIDACFGSSGNPSYMWVIVGVGIFILGALLIKSLI